MAWETGQYRKKAKPRVAVAVPNRGHFALEFTHKMWMPIMTNRVPEFDIVWLLNREYSITVARNTLVDDALKADADYIMWLDDDIIVEGMSAMDAIRTLFYQCQDQLVVSGLYRAKNRDGIPYCAWTKSGQLDNGQIRYSSVTGWTPGSNFISVDAVGLGFCMMKIDIFKKLARPWFQWDTKDQNSEDFMLCRKIIEELHGKITVRTDIRLTHLGHVAITSDGSIRTESL